MTQFDANIVLPFGQMTLMDAKLRWCDYVVASLDTQGPPSNGKKFFARELCFVTRSGVFECEFSIPMYVVKEMSEKDKQSVQWVQENHNALALQPHWCMSNSPSNFLYPHPLKKNPADAIKVLYKGALATAEKPYQTLIAVNCKEIMPTLKELGIPYVDLSTYQLPREDVVYGRAVGADLYCSKHLRSACKVDKDGKIKTSRHFVCARQKAALIQTIVEKECQGQRLLKYEPPIVGRICN